jgi:hypothetical protein
LTSWIEQIAALVKSRKADLRALQQERQKRLAELTGLFLPDLSEAALTTLAKEMPGVITSELVATLRSQKIAELHARSDALMKTFDPTTYTSRQLELSSEIAKQSRQLEALETAFTSLGEIADLDNLIERGYGTVRYAYKWFQLQYYKDRRRAKQIIKEQLEKSWVAIGERYGSLKGRCLTARNKLVDLNLQQEALERNYNTYESFRKDLQNVDQTVLELLQIRLKAALDSSSGSGDSLGWRQFASQIVKRQKEIAELQEVRERVSEQLAQVDLVNRRALRASCDLIPDEYVNHLRVKTRMMHSSGMSVCPFSGIPNESSEPLFLMDENWKLEAVIYNAMAQLFDSEVSIPQGDVSDESATTYLGDPSTGDIS